MSYIIGEETHPGLEPHQVLDTISLNKARKAIPHLSRILMAINLKIEENSKIVADHRRRIDDRIDKIATELDEMILFQNEVFTLQLLNEFREFTRTMSRLTRFLRMRSILPYEDAYERYLNELMEKQKGESADSSIMKAYEKMMSTYIEEKNFADNVYKREDPASLDLTFGNVDKNLEKLFKLRYYGKELLELKIF